MNARVSADYAAMLSGSSFKVHENGRWYATLPCHRTVHYPTVGGIHLATDIIPHVVQLYYGPVLSAVHH